MTERTQAPHDRPSDGRRAQQETADEVEQPGGSGRAGWSDIPARLRLALALSVLGAALLILGPALGLVANQPPAAFGAFPLLIVLALLPPLLAVAAMWARGPVVAAGVLIGSALLSPGRAVVDLQFARDALLASRPELLVPTSLAPMSAAAGLWLLVAGHAAMAAAGLLAGTAGAEPGSAYARELDDAAISGETSGEAPGETSGEVPGTPRRYLIGWAFACATVATVGLLLPPFQSHNAFLLTRDVIASPFLVRTGGLLIVAAVVLGCVFAASSTRPAMARGVLIGLLAAIAGSTLPAIAGSMAVDWLDAAPGPYLALLSIGLLTLVAFLLPTAREWALRRIEEFRGRQEPATAPTGPLHLVAGILGVLAGGTALIGGLGSLVVVDAGLEQPASFANRQLVPAGVLVALLGATLLVGRWSAAVRPAFTVSLVSVLLVGAGALDAGLTGAGVGPAVHIGAGVWFTGFAMIIAVVAAAAAGAAGSAERDEVDLTERGANVAVVAPAVVTILLAAGAFALPAVRAPGFVAPGIWSEFRLTSWGLLLGLVVVIAVCVLAPLSRPARAASLLLGAAVVVGVRLLEFPLTGGRVEQATAGPGTWLSLACLAALVVTALVAALVRPAKR